MRQYCNKKFLLNKKDSVMIVKHISLHISLSPLPTHITEPTTCITESNTRITLGNKIFQYLGSEAIFLGSLTKQTKVFYGVPVCKGKVPQCFNTLILGGERYKV
uniref:Uncharacterized protein n=1 Tax=Cacopsylla melanoneura TaxID=428564 RepID=A0A8D8SLN7_9HEMI